MIKNVVCAVSGGVDSAVAAILLKRKGYRVTGLFMRNWDIADETGKCSADKDCEYAKFVCDHVGIPFQEINFVKEYWNEVFSQLVQGYADGITPNPDILCNKHVKFGHLFRHVTDHIGADAIATGHYARNSAGQYLEGLSGKNTQRVNLLRSVDQSKDQTLFLSQIPQMSLQRTMFPIGDLLKSTVRTLAIEAGLEAIARKKESTGICFIGKRHFQDFIEEYLEPAPGNFLDVETSEIVGQHKGVHYFTIGQRTLIGGLSRAYFVASRDSASRTITVATGTDHPSLYSDSMTTSQPHWINKPADGLEKGKTVTCQFRFQHTYPLIGCRVTMNYDDSLDIHLNEPIRALSCGQYAVLYDDQVCLGSARIIKVGPSVFELTQKSVHSAESI